MTARGERGGVVVSEIGGILRRARKDAEVTFPDRLRNRAEQIMAEASADDDRKMMDSYMMYYAAWLIDDLREKAAPPRDGAGAEE